MGDPGIEPRARLRALPAGIWAMGLGSMLMDISSELIHSLLPIFMVSVLGASMLTVGAIEGIAEATAAFAKVFSGTLSDRLGHRKWLMVSGYALSAFTKPLFPLAGSIGWVFAARFADRVGKGIRGAPRDALVADITEPAARGAAYGLRQALDSVGAVLGPVLAMLLLGWLATDLRLALWVAVVPAVLTVLLLAIVVREPPSVPKVGAAPGGLRLGQGARLPPRYWAVVAVGTVFTLARFSEAFLVLRGQDIGLATAMVPIVMVVMNLVYAAVSYPAGLLADRGDARRLLLVGLAILVLADLVLAQAGAAWQVLAGSALWGLHMGLTQGLMSKLVADCAPTELRGTAFGIFNLLGGVAMLLASVIAGALWSALGPAGTFRAGACFAALAAGSLLLYRPSRAP